jgi:serine/threonine protein kinase
MEAALKSGVRWMGEEDEERWSDHDLGSPLLASAKLMGRYALIEPIGHGGTSTVWRALDERENAHVAVKLMAQDPQREARLVERFKREVELAAQLDGDAYVKIKDSGVEDGRAFLVMELLEGESLQERLGRVRRFSARQAVDLSQGLREALTRAHALEIVHRDIKPGNIFIKDDGTLKILDFGVARLADSSMTASGYIVGTPDFMSPEQARGRDIDQRSDIFSTGGVFYCMLSGRKPFAAADLPAVLHKVENDDPLALNEAEAPAGLSRIISKAMSKSAARRHQELGELLADLTRFQREYDRESREMALNVRRRAIELQAMIERTRPDGVGDELFSLPLRERYPVLEDRGPEALGVVPFRRQAVREILEDIEARHNAVVADVTRYGSAGMAT